MPHPLLPVHQLQQLSIVTKPLTHIKLQNLQKLALFQRIENLVDLVGLEFVTMHLQVKFCEKRIAQNYI